MIHYDKLSNTTHKISLIKNKSLYGNRSIFRLIYDIALSLFVGNIHIMDLPIDDIAITPDDKIVSDYDVVIPSDSVIVTDYEVSVTKDHSVVITLNTVTLAFLYYVQWPSDAVPWRVHNLVYTSMDLIALPWNSVVWPVDDWLVRVDEVVFSRKNLVSATIDEIVQWGWQDLVCVPKNCVRFSWVEHVAITYLKYLKTYR